MNVYIDTSGLVKLLIEEDGSDHMELLWNEADARWAGLLAYPETRAALAAAARESRVTRAGFDSRKIVLERLWGEIYVIHPTEDIALAAGEHAETFGLRGYDSVHLASALTVADPSLVFVTWDDELAQGAREAGLLVAPEAV